MRWIDRMERRFGWMSFPGFLRCYAILHGLVYVLQIFRPDMGAILDFDRDGILAGEVWRLFTFPFASSGIRGLGTLGILCFIFMFVICFIMSDALEGAWGTFRTSLFYYAGILGLIAGNFISPEPSLFSGFIIYLSAFLAFATLFPRVEFLIMFIIPVQVRWLALLLGIGITLNLVGLVFAGQWSGVAFLLLAYMNYIFWAGLPAIRGRKTLIQAAKRRRKFETDKQPAGMAFHHCAKCQRTEQSNPELEFRISTDGKEYCLDHLPEGEK